MHVTSIWGWETGRQAPGRRALSALSRELGVEVVVAALRDEGMTKQQELPKVGDVWTQVSGEVRSVDMVAVNHVGFVIRNGIRNIVTHAVWRRWAKRATLTHRQEQ